MRNLGSNSQGGYTIVEIIIVMFVLAILVAFAIMALGDSGNNLERQNIAKEYKVALERARFDSVKRRASSCTDMARVEITSATTFNLVTDSNQNGTTISSDNGTPNNPLDDITDPTEIRTIDFGNRSNVEIVFDPDDPAPVYPIITRFDQRGHSSTGACGAAVTVIPPIVFCNLPCNADSAISTNSNIIFVSKTGTAAFMEGGASVPTFTDPTVATADPCNPVNPLLAVWGLTAGNASACPTPTPIPTPTPTPTPIPTPTPTPTPTPGPPTPTPTPLPACAEGVKPSVGNCACYCPLNLVGQTCRFSGCAITP